MRNPFPSLPISALPLPDCIVNDAWWVVVRDERPRRDLPRLRLISGNREEGPHDESIRKRESG